MLISHNHFDHLDYPSVTELNKRYGERLSWFCGRGMRQWFLDNGIQNVIELDWWEEYYFSVREAHACVHLCCLLFFLEKGGEHFILSSSTLVLFQNVWVGKNDFLFQESSYCV